MKLYEPITGMILFIAAVAGLAALASCTAKQEAEGAEIIAETVEVVLEHELGVHQI